MPKTPDELKKQIEDVNDEQPATDGIERTAEGLEVETPTRDEFFANLDRVSKPQP